MGITCKSCEHMSATKRVVLFLFSIINGRRKELMRERSRRFPGKLKIDYGTVPRNPVTGGHRQRPSL